MSQARDLAAALRRTAVDAGTSTPSVHGADWHLATVTAVGTDGTVTADGIVARRLQSYTGPAVGDLISITQSSTGSWLAKGKLESGGNGGWTALPLPAGWSPQANYYPPAYRIYSDGTAGLSGMAVLSGSLASGTVVMTLPAEACPAANVRFPCQVAVGFFGVMTIFPSGQIQLGDFSGTLSATGNKWAQYDVAARYRRI